MGVVLTRLNATHACILTSLRSTMAYATASLPRERSPTTPRKYRDIHGFGGKLEPRYILGTGSLDQ